MPKSNNPSRKIKTVQQMINQYISTTKSNDNLEKQAHIRNIINSFKLTHKNKRFLNNWVNNTTLQQTQQQQLKTNKCKNKNTLTSLTPMTQ